MEKFIRIDMKGHWRGTEHVSSVNGLAGEWDEETGKCSFEKGISCYSLRDAAQGIENLRLYWMENNRKWRAADYEGLQVTIFAGEKVGEGADFEDIAICTQTLAEIDAVEFMGKVLEAYEQFEDEEISEEEYYEILENLI